MAVISVRLNTKEEQMIDFLADHYGEERSSLIKHSINEMYEDLIDRKVIEDFEAKKYPVFVSAKDLVTDLL